MLTAHGCSKWKLSYYLSVYCRQHQCRHLEDRFSSVYPFHIWSVLPKVKLSRYLTCAALMFISPKTLDLDLATLTSAKIWHHFKCRGIEFVSDTLFWNRSFILNNRFIPVRILLDQDPILGTLSARREYTLHGLLSLRAPWTHTFPHTYTPRANWVDPNLLVIILEGGKMYGENWTVVSSNLQKSGLKC